MEEFGLVASGLIYAALLFRISESIFGSYTENIGASLIKAWGIWLLFTIVISVVGISVLEVSISTVLLFQVIAFVTFIIHNIRFLMQCLKHEKEAKLKLEEARLIKRKEEEEARLVKNKEEEEEEARLAKRRNEWHTKEHKRAKEEYSSREIKNSVTSFEDLIGKSFSILQRHAPVQSMNDVNKLEEAVEYVKQAERLRLSNEQRAKCREILVVYQDTINAGRAKLTYKKLM